MKNEIVEALNIEPVDVVYDKSSEVIQDGSYDAVINNLAQIAELATDALKDATAIAAQSQHPRAFEALAQIIEQSISANKEMAAVMAQKNKDLGLTGQQDNRTVNNIISVGSTADVLKLLKKANDESIDE